jgi:hypothetical protein
MKGAAVSFHRRVGGKRPTWLITSGVPNPVLDRARRKHSAGNSYDPARPHLREKTNHKPGITKWEDGGLQILNPQFESGCPSGVKV